MTNARCLTEGVDIPTIDAVMFADPKQSKIDIVQAAGRALRIFKGKEFGYIIVPIVIEDINSANSAFQQIINVIAAMGMSDDRIIEEFKTLVSGRKGKGRIIEFDLPKEFKNINYQEFLSNIEIRIWDRLSFAKSVVGESEFVRWMNDNTKLSEKTRKNYGQAVRKISNDLVRRKLAYSSLADLMQSEDPVKLKKEYFDIQEYKELDIRGKRMYSAGFNKLIEFHQSKFICNDQDLKRHEKVFET
jgi:predicted helicase